MRVVAMDIGGSVTLDTTVQQGAVPIPQHTERIAIVGGETLLGGAAGWHSGAQLAQVGARSLIGAGCTLTSSATRTVRGTGRVGTAFVVAADAVSGYSIVTTRLPADITALAIVLETAEKVDDERGDALDLGLDGASRVVGEDGLAEPPRMIVSGSRMINVFNIRPDGNGKPVEVTVASGEHLHLGGVIGGRNGADVLAESLRRTEVGGTLGALFDTSIGKSRVRWVPQPKPKPPAKPKATRAKVRT
jgi:hypothetical protein